MYHEIKSILRNDTVFYSLVIVTVAVLAFGLGRLSVEESNTGTQESAGRLAPLTPLVPATATATPTQVAPSVPLEATTLRAVSGAEQGAVVASKSGTKYHLPSCPGASQIKEANRITFTSAAEARASGYTPAANCPGLE